MRVLAIDPGYERLGIAVLEKLEQQKETLLYSDCFKTSAALSFPERLGKIGQEIKRIIDLYQPEALSIETLLFTNNQKTAMKVAEVRGAIICEAVMRGMSVWEYTPLQIKVAVAGYGGSDKRQVTTMVKKLVTIEKEIAHDDEYDAIAAGLTYLASHKAQEHA